MSARSEILRLAFLVERVGPYHAARFARIGREADVTVLELQPHAATYAWEGGMALDGFRIECVPPPSRDRASSDDVRAALAHMQPDVVVVNGWADPAGHAALAWARASGRPAVLLSDSQERDETRVWWKERVKRAVVAAAQAAFAAGSRHREYLAALGMPAERTTLGYDAVDNDHFARGAAAARANEADTRRALGLPERYFLACSRFIPKKNLPTLVRAFAAYREQHGVEAWSLVLVGDGPERGVIEALVRACGLSDVVRLPGFIQMDKLPSYYGLASAFVHASTTDQWGLVVNEAMASGLPVLVSEPCGCVPELVHDNGFVFDPIDPDALADLLSLVATGLDLAEMGAASERVVAEWGLDRFADGFFDAIRISRSAPPRRLRPVDRLVLALLALR